MSRIEIVNKGKRYDKDLLRSIFGDFDKDGIINIDDVAPLNKNIKGRIEKEFSMGDVFESVLDLRKSLDKNLEDVVDIMDDFAPEDAKIYGRTKTPFSIFKKLVDKRLLDEQKGLTDLIGTTIAVDDFDDLQTVKKSIEEGALGEVIDYEDYYSSPKGGYRAYHYIVRYNGLPVEIQIKTKRQKAINELSHEFYKKGTLNTKYMKDLTEMAVLADEGDVQKQREFDRLIKLKSTRNKLGNIKNGSSVYADTSKYARGGKIEKKPVEIKNYKRNVLGTLDFDMHIKGMRGFQNFSVYPISASDKNPRIIIQSDKRFGYIDPDTGMGISSKTGSSSVHLQKDLINRQATFFHLTSDQLSTLKDKISLTKDSNAGNYFIKTDNSGADLLETGGLIQKNEDVYIHEPSGAEVLERSEDEDGNPLYQVLSPNGHDMIGEYVTLDQAKIVLNEDWTVDEIKSYKTGGKISEVGTYSNVETAKRIAKEHNEFFDKTNQNLVAKVEGTKVVVHEKFEKGGEMKRSKSAVAKDRKYTSDQPHEKSYAKRRKSAIMRYMKKGGHIPSNFEKVLETADFEYYADLPSGDEDVIMIRKSDGELVSDNYMAENAMYEDIINDKVTWSSPDMEYNIREIRKQQLMRSGGKVKSKLGWKRDRIWTSKEPHEQAYKKKRKSAIRDHSKDKARDSKEPHEVAIRKMNLGGRTSGFDMDLNALKRGIRILKIQSPEAFEALNLKFDLNNLSDQIQPILDYSDKWDSMTIQQRKAELNMLRNSMKKGGEISSDRHFTQQQFDRLTDDIINDFSGEWTGDHWIIKDVSGIVRGTWNPDLELLSINGSTNGSNPLVRFLYDNSFVSIDEYDKLNDGGKVNTYTLEQYLDDYSSIRYGNPYGEGSGEYEVEIIDNEGSETFYIWGESADDIRNDLLDKLSDEQALEIKKMSKGGSTFNDGVEFKKGGQLARDKWSKVMGEFKRGELYSSSGDLVTDKEQAMAIAYSESRKVDSSRHFSKGGGVDRKVKLKCTHCGKTRTYKGDEYDLDDKACKVCKKEGSLTKYEGGGEIKVGDKIFPHNWKGKKLDLKVVETWKNVLGNTVYKAETPNGSVYSAVLDERDEIIKGGSTYSNGGEIVYDSNGNKYRTLPDAMRNFRSGDIAFNVWTDEVQVLDADDLDEANRSYEVVVPAYNVEYRYGDGGNVSESQEFIEFWNDQTDEDIVAFLYESNVSNLSQIVDLDKTINDEGNNIFNVSRVVYRPEKSRKDLMELIDSFDDQYGTGGLIIATALGAYFGYKAGRSMSQKKDVFSTEKRLAKKLKERRK